MIRRTLAVLVLLALPLAHADATQVGLQATDDPISATAGSTVVTLTAHVSVSADRAAYLKVLPVPGNAVFDNGTVDGAGWWTEVYVGESNARIGATIGSGVVELGPVSAAQGLAVKLKVHFPASMHDAHRVVPLAYAVAIHAQASGTGSGGQLDPSTSWLPKIRFGTPPAASPASPPAVPPATPPPTVPPVTAEGTLTPLQSGGTDTQSLPEEIQVGRMVLPFVPTAVLAGLAVVLSVLLVVLMAARRRRQRRERAATVLAMDELLGGLPPEQIARFMNSAESHKYLALVEEARRIRHG